MIYKKAKEKISTIRVKESTKIKLVNLNFAKKGVSFDDILNELLNSYEKKK